MSATRRAPKACPTDGTPLGEPHRRDDTLEFECPTCRKVHRLEEVTIRGGW